MNTVNYFIQSIQSSFYGTLRWTCVHKKKTVAVVLAVLGVLLIKRKKCTSNPRRLKPSTVGSTELLTTGCFDWPNYDCIINVAVQFENNILPSLEALIQVFEEHIAQYAQFRSVPFQEQKCGPVTWITQKMNVSDHFYTTNVSAFDEIDNVIDGIINTNLHSKSRPWWEVHYIMMTTAQVNESSKCSNHGHLVFRLHHALGDGVSLMEMFSEVIRDVNGLPIENMGEIFSPAHFKKRAANQKVSVLRRMINWPWVFLDVVRNVCSVMALGIIGFDTPCCVYDHRTVLPYQNDKVTVYFPSHRLSLIKQIKTALVEILKDKNITVNDIEYAIMSGTIRRYLSFYGENPDRVQQRSLTALAFPEHVCPETRYSTLLRNNWTLICNEIPVSEKDPMQRILKSHLTWNRAKNSTLIPVSRFIHKFVGPALPLAMQSNSVLQFWLRTTLAWSNLPGPQVPVYVAGRKLDRLHMIFPNICPQMGFISLNGMIHGCLCISRQKNGRYDPNKMMPLFFKEEIEVIAKACKIPQSDIDAAFTM